MRRLRIAVVNNFFPPRVGGSAHLSDTLAQGYAREGHQVLVLTASYRDAPADEVRGGCRVLRFPSWTLPKTPLSVSFDIAYTGRPGLLRRVSRVLDGFRPDVIHQHGQFFDLTWATGLYARSRDVPVLLTVHTRLTSPRPHYGLAFRLADAALVRPLLAAYRPRVVVLDALMDDYIRTRFRGAYRDLVYIPVGVDTARLGAGDPARVRGRHRLGDRPVIASIGHVIPLRDRVRLVRALPAVLRRVPDAAVLVIGGDYFDRYRREAARLGVDHAVIPVGPVPHDEIADYLAAAALETHDLEGIGLGTASLESMAAGCPVVAAIRPDNFPGVRLRSGEHLYLVDGDDPGALAGTILEILNDPVLARKVVGSAGQRLVHEHFTMESVLQRYLDVLHATAR